MYNKYSKFLSFTVILVILLSLVGCTSTVEDDPDDIGDGSSVLRIGTPYGINTLNPYMTTADGDGYVIRQVIEPLVSGEIGDLKPLLAETWDIVDDYTWDFKLRENAYWHEGNDVYEEGANVNLTSKDVKAAFDFVMDPANKASYQALFVDVIKSVEIIDEYNVRFITHEPSAWLLTVVGRVPIFSVKAIEELGVDVFSRNPIGSGPFKFVEYRPDDRVILEKNDKYHIEPHLDEVIFLIIPDSSVSAVALQTEEIDISFQIPPTELDLMADYEHIYTVPNARGSYRYIALNCGHPILSDIRVREALSLTLNMQEIVSAIFGNPSLADVAYSAVVPGIPGYREDFEELWDYDIEKAKTLLTEAGWILSDDGKLQKDGETMSFVIKTAPDAERSKLGIIIATEFKKLGIDAVAQSLEWATLIDDMNVGDYDILISGGYGGEDGLYQMFHSVKGGGPELNYHNEEVNELLSAAKMTVDLEERTRILEEATRLIALDRPHIPAYLQYMQVGINKKVENFDPPSAYLPLTSNIRNVSKK